MAGDKKDKGAGKNLEERLEEAEEAATQARTAVGPGGSVFTPFAQMSAQELRDFVMSLPGDSVPVGGGNLLGREDFKMFKS